jgi:hypothetical protein
MTKRLAIGSLIAVVLVSMLLVSACSSPSGGGSSSNNWAGTWNGTVTCSILSGPIVLQIQPPSGNNLSVTYTFHGMTNTFVATISGNTATYQSSTSTTQLTISGNTMTFAKTDCQTATLTRQ